MAGYTSTDPCQGTLLQGTSLLQCAAGVIGALAGQSYDTTLFGVYILPTAVTAANLSIGGLLDSAGAAQPLIVTGSTTVDYFWFPPAAILNSRAAFTFTPSVAAKIWVFLRAYIGPESPR